MRDFLRGFRPLRSPLSTLLVAWGLSIPFASSAAAAPVVVTADETLDSGVFRLTWTGGTPPYTAYKFFSPVACGVQAFATTGTSFTLPVLATDTLTFYNISDSTSGGGPNLTISTPAGGTVLTTPTGDVTGTITPPDTPVCVNNLPALVTGNSYSITGVLLALGANDIRANATAPSGNLAFTTTTVTRNATNTPPIVTIITPADVCDPTPRIAFNLSDNAGLDTSRFKVVLNGAVMSGVVIDSTTPTFVTAHLDLTTPLTPGTQVVRVTVPDNSGATGHATSSWTYGGPKITTITPRVALPNATLTINGCGFSTTASQNLVQFSNGTPSPFLVAASTATTSRVTVTIPVGTVDGPVSVLVDNAETNNVPLDVQISRLNNIDLHVAVDVDGYMYTDGFYPSSDPTHPYAVIYKTSPDGRQSGVLTLFGTATDITGLTFDPTRTTLYVTTVEDRATTLFSREVPTNLRPNFGQGTCSLTGTVCTSNANCSGTGNVCQQPYFYFYDSYIWTLDRNGSPLGSPSFYPANQQFSSLDGISVDANYIYFGAYDGINWRMSILRAPRLGGTASVLANFGLSLFFFNDLSSSSNGNLHVSYARADLLSQDYARIYTLNSAGSTLWIYGRTNEDLQGVVADCRNQLFVASGGTANFYEISSGGALVATRSTTESFPYNLDLDRNGNVYTTSYDSVSQIAYLNRSAYRDTACADDFRVVLSGDNVKIIADTDTAGIETPNTQAVILQAVFQPHGGGTGDSPVFPAGTVVSWSCVDTDDPATSTAVDPPAAYDNHGGFDGSPVFTAEASYGAGGTVVDCRSGGTTTTNIILNGTIPTTKVRFHPSDAPGDNFLVTLSIQVPRVTGTFTRSAASQVMTVWKRLRIEADSMGYNAGPSDLDDDDAFIGDMPDPDTSMLLSAFQQAYVEVVLPGVGARTNAAFDPHVPNVYQALPGEIVEVTNQGALVRDLATNTGAWGAYIQTGYEGPENEDADPLPGPSTAGVSDLHMSSLTFPEVIRDMALTGMAGGGGCLEHVYDEQFYRRANVVHEVLHEFNIRDLPQNTCDGSNGILEGDPQFPYFIGDQLLKIRSAAYPGAP